MSLDKSEVPQRELIADDVLHMVDFGELPRSVPAELPAIVLREQLRKLSITMSRETGVPAIDLYSAVVSVVNNRDRES